jgi:hypothetical protein
LTRIVDTHSRTTSRKEKQEPNRPNAQVKSSQVNSRIFP